MVDGSQNGRCSAAAAVSRPSTRDQQRGGGRALQGVQKVEGVMVLAGGVVGDWGCRWPAMGGDGWLVSSQQMMSIGQSKEEERGCVVGCEEKAEENVWGPGLF